MSVWNRQSGARRNFALSGPRASAFSPDGRWLAAHNGGPSIELWDLDAPESPCTIGDPAHPVTAIALNSDGSLAITGTTDGMIELWDTASLQRTNRWRAGHNDVSALRVVPSGDMLVVGQMDGALSLWELGAPRSRLSLPGNGVSIRSIDMPRDGRFLATASDDDTLRLYDIDTGRELGEVKDAGRWVSFSPDGSKLVVAGPSRAPRLLSVPTLQTQLRAPPVGTEFNSVAFSPDGKTVAIGATGSNALLWDVSGPAHETMRLATDRFTVTAVTWLNEGRRLVTANPYRSIQFWDPQTGEECGTFESDAAMNSPIVVSVDGSTIAVITRDQQLKIWRGR
jgi:WD40 repeat protein